MAIREIVKRKGFRATVGTFGWPHDICVGVKRCHALVRYTFSPSNTTCMFPHSGKVCGLSS